MLQTLFHIPSHLQVPYLGDVPLFGVGLLLAIWAVGSVVFLAWLVRRQGWNAETRGYVPLLLVIGAAIWLILPRLCDTDGLPIRGYGMMLLLAVAAGVGLAAWRARRVGLDTDLIYSLAFWVFIPGLIGARVFYVIQKWPGEFEPIYRLQGFWPVLAASINLAQGGLVVYGALLAGIAGALIFIVQRRLPPLAMLDLITPSLLLGLAIGRLGCLLNGCCYGGPCALPWAVTFPPGSPVHIHQFDEGQLALYGLRLTGPAHQLPKIAGVEAGSPAEKAGLVANRWIDTVDDVPVDTVRAVYAALIEAGAHGGPVAIQTVAGAQHRWTPSPAGAPANAPSPEGIGGLRLSGNADRLPIIAKVVPGSAAEKLGLRAGQEIFAVGDRRVRSIADARELLAQDNRPGRSLSIITVNDRRTATLAIAGPPGRSKPVHPTQLYSAINAALLCLFLLAYDPWRRRDGELWALFLTLYPITRFLLEIIRVDEPAVFGTGMSISQNVSWMLLLCAAVLWVAILLKPPGLAFARQQAPATSV